MSGDTFNTGFAGSVGPGSQSHGTTFNVDQRSVLQQVDLGALATDLVKLRMAMGSQAADTQQYQAVAAISGAQDAAEKGDRSTVAAKLKEAGHWAFDVATKISTTVAAEAVKKSMGWG